MTLSWLLSLFLMDMRYLLLNLNKHYRKNPKIALLDCPPHLLQAVHQEKTDYLFSSSCQFVRARMSMLRTADRCMPFDSAKTPVLCSLASTTKKFSSTGSNFELKVNRTLPDILTPDLVKQSTVPRRELA